MFFILSLLILPIASISASEVAIQRVEGGQLAQIIQYPETVALLYSSFGNIYSQSCAGSVLTKKAILTAAHCLYDGSVTKWRARVGSSYANSGGTVYHLQSMTIHASFNKSSFDNDIAIMRTNIEIDYGSLVKPASIAGFNYVLADNQPVWAVGWGKTSYNSSSSEQLRHVQLWTINQGACRARYRIIGRIVTDNMLCSGWLDIGGHDQCQGDSGGPLYHNGNVVGICSWGKECGMPQYPGVNTRVSKYTPWIQANA